MMDSGEAWRIARLDAHDQAAAVRDGTLAPDAPVAAALVRIAEIDPRLNAVSFVAADHARAALATLDRTAAMAGVPTLLKSSLAYPGFPQTSGSRARAAAVATTAWPYARRMAETGLIPVGMSTMPEFGLLCSGEPLLTGPTLNPWSSAHTAGGSSTGAAVAVATGLVPVAHASDAGGSIRIPASNCGVVGFKPGRGWNLRARAHDLVDDLLCSDSLIGRTVRDVAWGARAMRPAGKQALMDEGSLRIAVDMAGLTGAPDSEVATLIEATAGLCATSGHRVERVTMPIDRPALAAAFRTLMPYLGGAVADIVAAANPGVALDTLLEPWTLGLAERRMGIAPEDLAYAHAAIAAGERALAGFHQDWDVVLSPVTRSAPLPLGAMAPTRPFADLWATLFDYIDYTPLHNMLGLPSVSLPLGMTGGGLPVGSLLSGPAASDDRLLTLSAQLEIASPWHDRWPPIA